MGTDGTGMGWECGETYGDRVGMGTDGTEMGWGWGRGGDGKKLVGMGWVWGEQFVPVQLSILNTISTTEK